jgi:hypothetical protein
MAHSDGGVTDGAESLVVAMGKTIEVRQIRDVALQYHFGGELFIAFAVVLDSDPDSETYDELIPRPLEVSESSAMALKTLREVTRKAWPHYPSVPVLDNDEKVLLERLCNQPPRLELNDDGEAVAVYNYLGHRILAGRVSGTCMRYYPDSRHYRVSMTYLEIDEHSPHHECMIATDVAFYRGGEKAALCLVDLGRKLHWTLGPRLAEKTQQALQNRISRPVRRYSLEELVQEGR